MRAHVSTYRKFRKSKMATIAMATDYIMCNVKYGFEEHVFHLSYDDSFI